MTNTDKTVSTISDELLASMLNEADNEEWDDMALALRELQSLRAASITPPAPETITALTKIVAEVTETEATNTRNPGTDYHARTFIREHGPTLLAALSAASITPPGREGCNQRSEVIRKWIIKDEASNARVKALVEALGPFAEVGRMLSDEDGWADTDTLQIGADPEFPNFHEISAGAFRRAVRLSLKNQESDRED